MVHIYNRILFNHKNNEIMTFTATLVVQPPVGTTGDYILSEVNKEEKENYHMIKFICGI